MRDGSEATRPPQLPPLWFVHAQEPFGRPVPCSFRRARHRRTRSGRLAASGDLVPCPAAGRPGEHMWTATAVEREYHMDTTNDPERISGLEQQISDLEAQLTEVRQQLSEAELDQWRARIDDLEVHVHLGSLETRDLLAPLVEDLRNAWLDAREQTARSASTASDAAGALRNGLDRAMDEIRTAVLQAKATVKR